MSAEQKDPLKSLGPALDCFQEAHFWIHMLEQYYHAAEPFRWHLNVFLKAIEEVPTLIGICLQNRQGFPVWFKEHRHALKSDLLLKRLNKERNFIVHQGMLKLASTGSIGITEGRGIKLGLNFPIDPLIDSDEAMDRFIYSLAYAGDFFHFLSEDEDSLPCVERYWRIPDVEGEIIDLCATAWLRIGEVISDTIVWLGEERPNLNLSCRHSGQRVHFKLYERKPLRRRMREFRAQEGFVRASRRRNSQK